MSTHYLGTGSHSGHVASSRARIPAWTDDDPLLTLRALCLSYPETSERLSHGEPTWFIHGKKTFANYANHHHDDRLGFWCAAPPSAQEILIDVRPESFFRPPYVGHRGWLGVYLDVPVDWDEIAGIVDDAYRCIAPQKLLALLASR